MGDVRRTIWSVLIIGLIMICSRVYADSISSPPPIKDQPALSDYLNEIYRNHNQLEVVTTNPDGNRNGLPGDTLLFNNSGTYYLEINVSSGGGTTWVGTVLSDTP